MERLLTIASDGKTFQVRSTLTHLEVWAICKTILAMLDSGNDPFPNPKVVLEFDASTGETKE